MSVQKKGAEGGVRGKEDEKEGEEQQLQRL